MPKIDPAVDTDSIPRLGWIRKRDGKLFQIKYITANVHVVGYCLRYSRRSSRGRAVKKSIYRMPLERFLREFKEVDHAS